MKIKLLLMVILLMFLLTSCINSTPVNQPKNNDTTDKKEEVRAEPNITFSLSSFKEEYTSDTSGTYFSEHYDGTGIVTAVGDEILVKKPYMVLLHVKKISGGDKNDTDRYQSIIVMNGSGLIQTSDWNTENTQKMIKPEYKIDIVGYLPYNEIKVVSNQ